MKKIKYHRSHLVSYAFLFSIICSVLLVTCKKEPEAIQPPSTTVPSNPIVQDVQYIYEDFDPGSAEAAAGLIEDFHDEIEAEEVNSRPIDEALWTLEAYLSGHLMDFSKAFTGVEAYEVYLTFNEDVSGDLAGDDILAAFNDAMDYVNDDLADLDVTFTDLSYYSEASGVHTFLCTIYAGTKTTDEREEGLPSYSGDMRRPVYPTSTTCSTPAATNDAVWQIINDKIDYQESNIACGYGYRVFTSSNNYQILPTTIYSGSNTYASLNKLYWRTNDNCILAGTTSDDGGDNTVNGWIVEAGIIIGQENAKLTYPNVVGYTRYYKSDNGGYKGWGVNIFTGTVVCVPGGIFN